VVTSKSPCYNESALDDVPDTGDERMAFWRRFPKPPASVESLREVFEAWKESKALHIWSRGVSSADLDRAESIIGRCLPRTFRAIYEASDGLSLLGGNLNFTHLHKEVHDYCSITTATEKFREWDWVFPDEILFIAGNGGDSQFGLWLPPNSATLDDAPVIEIGEAPDPFEGAIVGTTLAKFLKAWTAAYLLVEDAPRASLARLGLPQELWSEDLDDGTFAKIRAWADPDLPDYDPDPYQKGLSAEQLRQRLSTQ
jgi:SMI1 / KNR4 family (SUKH-1)